MTRARSVILTCAMVMFYLGFPVLSATAQTGCPSIGQINGLNGQPNAGLLNGAHVTIDVVGSSLQAGDTKVQNAANEWASIPGATYTFSVQNVDSVPSGSASASNPVVIFQVGPASDFAPGSGCAGAFMCTQPASLDSAGHVVIVQMELNPANTTDNLFFQEGIDHELGHGAFGLEDCAGCSNTQTIMASPMSDSTDHGPTTCDQQAVYRNSGGAYGTSSGSDGGVPRQRCAPGVQPNVDNQCFSPIIIDVDGSGFHLTSADDGVIFDIVGDGNPIQIAWTDSRYHNAFLGLPGPDGLIHNGKELFGNFTPQPSSDNPNGFLALAQYDKPENGGNGDGMIDDRDTIFSRLRLWIDDNHDGICQANELHTLSELGIYSLALDFIALRRTDEFGNEFRYRGKVNPGGAVDFRDERQHGAEVGRWAYDVFFVTK